MPLSIGVPTTDFDVLFRIAVACSMGVLFGLERQYNKKPVGFGPFAFVSTGAAAITVMGLMLSEQPLPVIGAILTGIGFLGAGAILKSGEKRVSGITTAASLWIFAVLGVVVGVGMYTEAVFIYLLVGIIVFIDHFFEKHGFGNYSKTVTITVNDASKVRDLEKILPKHRTFQYSFDNVKNEYTVTFLISGNKREVNMTLNNLVNQPSVLQVKVE